MFVLKRKGAEADYPAERLAAAEARFKTKTPAEIDALEKILIDWLPARDFVYDRAGFKRMLDLYRDISTEGLREHLFAFLHEITPVADEEGARLCIHADDPSFPIFGLPRVMSSAADVPGDVRRRCRAWPAG